MHDRSEVPEVAGVGELVEDRYFRRLSQAPRPLQQGANVVTSDEAGPPVTSTSIRSPLDLDLRQVVGAKSRVTPRVSNNTSAVPANA